MHSRHCIPTALLLHRFFHVFMDTDKSVPHYGKAPRRLASAYAGTAVYGNWKLEDPTIADPTVWYRGIPTKPERVGPDHGKFCLNPQKIEMCSNITAGVTFPPKPEAPLKVNEKATPWRAIHSAFMPTASASRSSAAAAKKL